MKRAKKKDIDQDGPLESKAALTSQRFPISCPGCGTNSRIAVATSGSQVGNSLDCNNCSTTYTWN